MRVERNAKAVCAKLKTDSPPLSGRLFDSNKQPGVKNKTCCASSTASLSSVRRGRCDRREAGSVRTVAVAAMAVVGR